MRISFQDCFLASINLVEWESCSWELQILVSKGSSMPIQQFAPTGFAECLQRIQLGHLIAGNGDANLVCR